MVSSDAPVTYAYARLPSKRRLMVLLTLASSLCAAGLVWVLWSLDNMIRLTGIFCNGSTPAEWPTSLDGQQDAYCAAKNAEPWIAQMHWYYGLVIMLIGILVAKHVLHLNVKYYKYVRQGVVIDKDTYGGGIFAFGYKIEVWGRNTANQKVKRWYYVTEGKYADLKKGDIYIP